MMVVASALALGAYMSYQDTKFLDNVEASMDQLACYAPRMEDLLEARLIFWERFRVSSVLRAFG